MKHYSAVIVCTSILAACSSTPEPSQDTAGASAGQAPVASTQAPPGAQARAPAASPTSGAGAATAVSRPAQNSVYFEYDSSAMKEEYRPVVTDHARYISNQRATRVTVEGNADERGSREYNLALGQRRAESVKERLTLLGVPRERIETISFGEEKPRSEDPSESAYAENRRADIVYANR